MSALAQWILIVVMNGSISVRGYVHGNGPAGRVIVMQEFYSAKACQDARDELKKMLGDEVKAACVPK